MAWEDIQGRKYDPVGRCIYCGSDGGSEGLTDEHIVPLSLGGDAVLRKASCRRCATITSQTELYLGRSIFHELRSHVGAPSRRRTLPTSLSANISVGDQEITREFLAADQPFALMLPIWDWPGIMRQVQPSAEFPVYNVRAYNFMPSTLRETLGLPEDAPLVVVEAVWQYSHHILHGLYTHKGPILTVANWSGQWPGLVGMLNLNASMTKAGITYSTLWSESFTDEFFLSGLRKWLAGETVQHDVSHAPDPRLARRGLPGRHQHAGSPGGHQGATAGRGGETAGES